MFRGINTLKLDPKGRMVMPTRYRELLQQQTEGQVVVTIDTEATCLLLYPLSEWVVIEQKLAQLPSFNSAARRIQRLLLGHATEIEMDMNGRVLLPPPLRDYAGLHKQAVLIGQGKKFEIWDEQQWNAGRERWLKDSAEDLDALPDDLKLLSL